MTFFVSIFFLFEFWLRGFSTSFLPLTFITFFGCFFVLFRRHHIIENDKNNLQMSISNIFVSWARRHDSRKKGKKTKYIIRNNNNNKQNSFIKVMCLFVLRLLQSYIKCLYIDSMNYVVCTVEYCATKLCKEVEKKNKRESWMRNSKKTKNAKTNLRWALKTATKNIYAFPSYDRNLFVSFSPSSFQLHYFHYMCVDFWGSVFILMCMLYLFPISLRCAHLLPNNFMTLKPLFRFKDACFM